MTNTQNGSWTNTEKICYIAHVWADKEKKKKFLKDFDYTEMARTTAEFIDCQPDNVSFLTHVENCFDVLEAEFEGRDSPKWTKDYFAKYY